MKLFSWITLYTDLDGDGVGSNCPTLFWADAVEVVDLMISHTYQMYFFDFFIKPNFTTLLFIGEWVVMNLSQYSYEFLTQIVVHIYNTLLDL